VCPSSRVIETWAKRTPMPICVQAGEQRSSDPLCPRSESSGDLDLGHCHAEMGARHGLRCLVADANWLIVGRGYKHDPLAEASKTARLSVSMVSVPVW
jgi:hypothetical protein